MRPRTIQLAVAVALLGVIALPLDAAIVTLTATDSGFVTEAGGSAKGDGAFPTSATYNYSVGFELHYATGNYSGTFAPMDRKNYFVFDLTSVTDPIVSATLMLNAGTYESVHPTESYAVAATSDAAGALMRIDSLLASHFIGSTEFDGPADPAITKAMELHGLLADGPLLGGIMVSAGLDDTTLSIPILPGYVSAFLGTRLVLGGKVLTVFPPDGTPQQPFGFTDFDVPGAGPLVAKLVLTTLDSTGTVPEPSTAALAIVGLLSLGFRKLRRATSRPSRIA